MSFDSWESISAAPVVMETVEPLLAYARVFLDPPLIQTSSSSLPASFNISPFDIEANPELACRGPYPLRSSPASPPFPPPPEHNSHLTSQNCWSHFNYVKTAKHPGIIVCVCVRLGTRHLSEQHSAICHSDTQTVAHILTPSSQPSPPSSPALRSGFPSSPSFTDSFWFPFWFLTSEAISGQPVVPLILTAYCVVSWAEPWAPGAGRGARNDLVPVAVQAKELWHHFH